MMIESERPGSALSAIIIIIQAATCHQILFFRYSYSCTFCKCMGTGESWVYIGSHMPGTNQYTCTL